MKIPIRIAPLAWFLSTGRSILICAGVLALAPSPGRSAAEPNLAKNPTEQVHSFALGQVQLLPSEFTHARDLNANYLLELDVDRLMGRIRELCGLKPKKEGYGGWEKNSSAVGHYLSACALQYAATGDERFKQRVDQVVDEMAIAQEAAGDGFVGCMPRLTFEQFSRGEIEFPAGQTKAGWVPWYYLHKEFAGLIDAYELAGSQKAREVLVKFSDWAAGILEPIGDERIQKMLRIEHGGMLESMAEVYRITGNERYLKLTEKFYHKAILDPLADGNGEALVKVHANTQVPKFIGLARRYQLTGNPRDQKASEFFFRYVLDHQTYINGGNSFNEHFGKPDELAAGLGGEMTETCNTYNMLQLCRLLFLSQPRAELMDYYEHALYNHILASQHPESGMFTYKYKLFGGYPQSFSTPFDSFWCCVGTGMENHAKYSQNIFSYDKDSLWVNLFIPSELDWRERGLKIRLDTRYPDAGLVGFKVSAAAPVELTFRLRWPAWAQGATLTVNGQKQQLSGSPGQYVPLKRTWRDGDLIEWVLPMRPRLEPLPDDPSKVAITYGPVTLAAALGRDNILVENLQGPPCAARWNWPLPESLPVLTALDRPVESWLKPVEGKPLTFLVSSDAASAPVTMIPCWRANTQRNAEYLDGTTAAGWDAKKEEILKNQKLVTLQKARVIDEVLIANPQSELDHRAASEKSSTGQFREKSYRDARRGGWFSYDVAVKPDKAMALGVQYWGGEKGERNFEIEVEGKTIATQELKMNQPGAFFTVEYAIPEELTKGKQQVKIRFVGQNGIAGGVYNIKTVVVAL